MALADPQSITVDGTTYSLPRIGFADRQGTFSTEGGEIRFRVSHQNGKRNRSVVRIENKKLSTDPLLPTSNVPVSMSVQLVVDRPDQGYTPMEVKAVLLAFCAWFTASSAANATKFVGGES